MQIRYKIVTCSVGLILVCASQTYGQAIKLSTNAKSSEKLTLDPTSEAAKGQGDGVAIENLNALTEAGVFAPGFPSKAPKYVPPKQAQRPKFNLPTQNESYTGIAAAASLLQMAAAFGQRVNPRASGKLFEGECEDCGKALKSDEVAAADEEVTSEEDPFAKARIQDEVWSYIKKESTLPYPELNANLRETYVNATIQTLFDFGGFTSHNQKELTSLCPNYEALNLNQRKAVMVYAYAAIFKQTSNYNFNQTATTAASPMKKNIGPCRLEYNAVKAIYKTYDLDIDVTEEEFNSKFAKDPYNSIVICSAHLYKGAHVQSSGEIGGFKGRFPDLNFDLIKQNLSQLQLCKVE